MKNLLRILRYARPYWHLIFVTGISVLVITALNLVTPWLVMDLVTVLTEGEKDILLQTSLNITIVLVLVYMARAMFTYFQRYLSHVAAWKLVADLRVAVYAHLQKLTLRYYHDKQTGQLMSRVVNDTATLEVLIAHAVPDLVANILIFFGIAVILFIKNPMLASFTLIPVPFLFVGGFLFTKKILPNFKKAQLTLAELNAVVQDNISGIKEIQVFNQQKKEKGRVQVKSENYAQAILKALRLSAIFHPSVELLSSFGTVIVVGLGGYFALQGRVSASDIVGFIMYLSLFYQPITTLARVMEDLQQANAGAERVFELLDTEPDIVDAKDAKKMEGAEGNLTFENISFQYLDEKPVLKNISFKADKGEMIAIVGPTGVGKTTIISLIARFYEPVAGRILLDGMDIKDLKLASLRRQISIVLQDVFLFNGTVGENIAYGNEKAQIDEIIAAAKIAQAHAFISSLPNGYDTYIGERGVTLSGGQKQRLAIARAVLRNTPILILDEATASVDVETEENILKAIQNLAGTRTIIVIAHRLSTVKKADSIIVLKEGEIVEEGKHEALMEKDGLYASVNIKH